MRFSGLKGLLDLICPPRCTLCGEFLERDEATLKNGFACICDGCFDNFTEVPASFCRRCGRPYTLEYPADHICGDCLKKEPVFDRAASAGLYDGLLRKAIHELKYNGRTELAAPLAHFMKNKLEPPFYPPDVDLILPVPLHVRRLRGRGFNQSLLLAKELYRNWSEKIEWNVLLRPVWTEPQMAMTKEQRRKNVRDAFKAAGGADLAYKSVLLLDDVFTTGATMEACCRVIKKAGASQVFILTLARVE